MAEAALACGVNFSQELVKAPVALEALPGVTHGNDPAILAAPVANGQFP